MIRKAPTVASMKGLYVNSRLVFQMFQRAYVSSMQHRGIRYVFMLVTLQPNAAKLLEIVFE